MLLTLDVSLKCFPLSSTGKYECIVEDDIVVYRRNGIIAVLPKPIVRLNKGRINLPCETTQVEIKCCVKPKTGTTKWTKNNVILDSSGNYKLLSLNGVFSNVAVLPEL